MSEQKVTQSGLLTEFVKDNSTFVVLGGGPSTLPKAVPAENQILCMPLEPDDASQAVTGARFMPQAGHTELQGFKVVKNKTAGVVFCAPDEVLGVAMGHIDDEHPVVPVLLASSQLDTDLDQIPHWVEHVIVRVAASQRDAVEDLCSGDDPSWDIVLRARAKSGFFFLKRSDAASVQAAPANLALGQTAIPVAVANSDRLLEQAGLRDVRLLDDQIEGVVDVPAGQPVPSVMAFSQDQLVAAVTPSIQTPDGGYEFVLDVPRTIFFDRAADGVDLRLGVPNVSTQSHAIKLPGRRVISAERLLEFDMTSADRRTGRKPFGIVVYTFTRTDSVMLVLESLKRQGVLGLVEVWMDGDQGKPNVRKALDAAEAEIREFGVTRVTRHRGNLGFRKLILQSLSHMVQTYDRFVVLEDDCFPSGAAIAEFSNALDRYNDDPTVVTTYGHHFLMPSELPVCPRFQGWGWATWSDRFAPFLEELIYLFSLSEQDFKDWAAQAMTPEILARIDATPPRNASHTLRNFFAWDEALTLVTALAGCNHAPTEKRCIYNFGVGGDSTHFTNIDWYRKPPFNMILKDEVWDHF